MANNIKTNETKTYRDTVHTAGRIWLPVGLALLFLVPTSICIHYDAWPALTDVLKGLLGVLPVFWTIGIIETFTYVPMLGTGGSYLGFFTGNITNLKAPCALNAMEITNVKAQSDEGEVISTIAIAVSAIVTTVIIAAGVLLLGRIEPILESPVLQPAFDNLLPALFGGLAVVYVSKNPRLSALPMIFMVILFICVPSLASSVSVLVPVGVLISVGAARVLYKKNLL